MKKKTPPPLPAPELQTSIDLNTKEGFTPSIFSVIVFRLSLSVCSVKPFVVIKMSSLMKLSFVNTRFSVTGFFKDTPRTQTKTIWNHFESLQNQ